LANTNKHRKSFKDTPQAGATQILGTTTNRDARKEDHEQSILLSLSNNIAKVRDKKDLLQALNTHLIALFPIVGFGITLLNEEGKSHSPFVVDSEDRIRR
jgi:formate hydrogenlyase transcriptional activator